MIALVGVLLLIGGAGDASTAVAADVSKPPHLPRWIWPGAVTVNPRPAPDSTGAPLRTTLCFQLQLGCDALGAVDPIDLATLRVELLAGSERRELVRDGAFLPGASGRLLEPGGAWIAMDAPLPPLTRCEVRLKAKSRSGQSLGRDGAWCFTTRAADEEGAIELAGDAARSVHFPHRVFGGLLKPSFDTSELFGQVPTYESMRAVTGPPGSPRPAVGALQRDWPLCGDYRTNAFFDGDPNLVREAETRRITSIEPDGDERRGLVVHVAPLPEGELYGIAPDRPLADDYPSGCSVLIVDGETSREACVLDVEESQKKLFVALRPSQEDLHHDDPPSKAPRRRSASDWKIPSAPAFPPDEAATPANFPEPSAFLKRLRPCGTPVCWFGRLDHEWDLVHRDFGRRLVVGFDRVPYDLTVSGVAGRCTTFKDAVEWFDFVHAVTSHLIERHGRACLDFYWSMFNEPDLRPLFWDGTDDQLLATYDLAVDAILRAFEDHDLPSAAVKIGGLELGALVAEPALLDRFLTHCSPCFERNFALLEPRLEGRHSRRLLALAKDGCGSPCDFVSLHEYKHAAFAISQLQWARQRALVIDPKTFAELAVVAFETDPDWNPSDDPATRAMFLGNGFWPSWAADWTRRAIAAAFADPAFARHEALITVWPVEHDFAGIPTLSSLVDRREADGTTTTITVPKDLLHFLTFLGWMGTDYFVIESAAMVAGGASDDGTRAGTAAGFGALARDELALLVSTHDPRDPENRDARVRTVQLKLDHAPFETGSITTYALDDGHGSVWPIARRRLDPSARTSFAPEEVDALERAARLEPIEEDRPLALPGGHLELRFEMPTNAIRFFRIRRAAR